MIFFIFSRPRAMRLSVGSEDLDLDLDPGLGRGLTRGTHGAMKLNVPCAMWTFFDDVGYL